MHIDWTIAVGNVIVNFFIFIGGLWWAGYKIYRALDRRVSTFEGILLTHAKTLVEHSLRMEAQDEAHSRKIDRHDELLVRLVGDVQRLIGHMEANSRRS